MSLDGRRPRRRIASAWAAALLALAGAWPAASRAPAGPGPEPAYVILGEDGRAVARVLTAGASCPALTIDGRSRAMSLRAPAQTMPLRPTQSSPQNSKPSSFPVLTCELRLPRGARTAALHGRRLALPPSTIRRIVVIGDTGCRLKASEDAYQACNDPRRYPFAAIAARAAAWKPDLVVHVGDLVYRENPCPQTQAACAGSPWGYGFDAWRADFFDPAAPLLAAAPWVMTRGNHESCSRAGQGWWRFIDPRPLLAGRDCNSAAQDVGGDYSAPFAVPIGQGAQIVVMDLSIAGGKPVPAGDPRLAQFGDAYRRLDALSRAARFTFAIDHYPIFGVAADVQDGAVRLRPGNAAIQSVFGKIDPMIAPPGVDVFLAGHVHLWEQIGFSTRHPSQFIAGFSGTQEDITPLPSRLPPSFTPAPGARVAHFSAWVDGFGYMTLERRGPRAWSAVVRDVRGRAVNRCSIVGRRSWCERRRVASPR